jgi:hypothetical protein
MTDSEDAEQTADEGAEQTDWAEVTARAWALGTGAALGLPLGPPGFVGGAIAGALLEPLALKLLQYLSGDAKRRSGEALSAACGASGVSAEETLSRMFSDEKFRLLAGTAMIAAAHTAWEDKVRTIGRSLATGLLASDEAEVDAEQMILSAIADMEAPHVALLDLFVACRPPIYSGEPGIVRLEIPEYSHSRSFNGEWDAHERKWARRIILEYRPRLAPVFPSLVGTLQRHGLAFFEDNSDREIKQLQKAVEQEAARRDQERRGGGTGSTPRRSSTAFNVRTVPGTWEPTELGEQVWLRFHEAGTNIPDVWLQPATDPQAPESDPGTGGA